MIPLIYWPTAVKPSENTTNSGPKNIPANMIDLACFNLRTWLTVSEEYKIQKNWILYPISKILEW